MLRHDFCICRKLWRSCSTTYRQTHIRLHPDFIPQALFQERIERFPTAFDNQRLYMVGM
jgi:hypothetical protein